MKTTMMLGVAALLVLCGCASNAARKTADDPDRKPVNKPAVEQPKHKIEERDGQYYIMMNQEERLCSDCDR